MMSLELLTRISTTCIVLSGASLLVGWYFIRSQSNRIRHRNAMLTATAFAALFLVFYVIRWSAYGSKPFAGSGTWRLLYFAVLIPHVVFAMVLGPMALRLIHLALWKRDYPSHRRLARITLPIWLYVAASGWLIFYLLHGRSY
jgi:putative membrane protein